MHLYQLLPLIDDGIVPRPQANQAIQPGGERMSQGEELSRGAKTADKITWDKPAK
jgi:hypothetical protein